MAHGEFDYQQPDFVLKMMTRPETRGADDLTQQLTTICKRRLGVAHSLARKLGDTLEMEGEDGDQYEVQITPDLLTALTHVRRIRDQDLGRLGCGLKAAEIIQRWNTIREGKTRFHYGSRD